MTSIFQALAELEKSGQPGALCTIISSQGSTPRHVGSKMLVYPGGRFVGTVGGGEVEYRVLSEAQATIQSGQSKILDYSMTDPQRGDPGSCGGRLEIFVEPILPMPLLVVIGCGHVGREVAHLAKWLGFRVAAVDDRAELCSPEQLPAADIFYPGEFSTLFDRLDLPQTASVVLTTRNVDVDVKILPGLLEHKVAYLGVIGSRRRWATTKSQLSELGIPSEKITMIHSPIGLRLGAESPREIAVSILAEIMMQRGQVDGESMSAQQK